MNKIMHSGHIAWVTWSDPRTKNALRTSDLVDIERRIRSISESGKYRLIVLYGDGQNFASGSNLREVARRTTGSTLVHRNGWRRVLEALATARVPIISAVHGACMGGGLELALASDFIIACENATFAAPEGRRGIIPGGGMTIRLPERIGFARAKELLLTGRVIGAREAQEIGLVEFVAPHDQLEASLLEKAEMIRAGSATALARIRLVLEASRRDPKAEALEAMTVASLIGSPSMIEGIEAFFEKRDPDFDRQLH